MTILSQIAKCKPKPHWLLVSVLSLLLVWGIPYWTAIEENLGLYSLFQLRGAITPPPELVIIKLNSSAAEQLDLNRQTIQWPRRLHAELVDRLSAAGARWIVFDIAFKEPRDLEEDKLLADAIKRSGRVVLFRYLKRYQVPAGEGFLDVEEVISPFPLLADAARASGGFILPKVPARVAHLTLYDHINNQLVAAQPLLLVILHNETLWQQFVAALRGQFPQASDNDMQAVFDVISRNDPWFVEFERAHTQPEWRQLLTALRHTGIFFINFYGPEGTLANLAMDTALRLTPPELQTFAGDKIVYIGYAESKQTEQIDAYRTVFSRTSGVDLSGVELSATVAGNLLRQQSLGALTIKEQQILLLFILLLAWGIVYGLPKRWISVVLAGALFTYCVVVYFLFAKANIWLPLVAPGCVLLWVMVWALIYNFEQARIRAQQIQQALSQYLPAAAAARLGGSISQFAAQHQLVSGVCLLSDIKGYTRLSETLDPQDLHPLMNRYYAELIAEVEKSGGIVANIVGDAMLALWLDESVTPELCAKAMQTALAIHQRLLLLPDLNRQLPTSFALHAGQFSLGNLGAAGHFEYSPVGDIINTTSRIEPFNRKLGTHLLCSTTVTEALKTAGVSLRYLGKFTMRNKTEAFALYGLPVELTGVTSDAEGLECAAQVNSTPGDVTTLALERKFAAAMACCEQHQFQEAIELLQDILGVAPDDGPSIFYLAQCLERCDEASAKAAHS